MTTSLPPEQPATKTIDDQSQEQPGQAPEMHALFQAWEHEDPDEQRETLAYLQQVLDEDRLGTRKLFQ